jgi:hypothetical protein
LLRGLAGSGDAKIQQLFDSAKNNQNIFKKVCKPCSDISKSHATPGSVQKHHGSPPYGASRESIRVANILQKVEKSSKFQR